MPLPRRCKPVCQAQTARSHGEVIPLDGHKQWNLGGAGSQFSDRSMLNAGADRICSNFHYCVCMQFIFQGRSLLSHIGPWFSQSPMFSFERTDIDPKHSSRWSLDTSPYGVSIREWLINGLFERAITTINDALFHIPCLPLSTSLQPDRSWQTSFGLMASGRIYAQETTHVAFQWLDPILRCTRFPEPTTSGSHTQQNHYLLKCFRYLREIDDTYVYMYIN